MAFIKAKFWDRGRCGWKIQDNNWTLSRFIPTKHQGHLCSLIHIISYPAFNTHSLYQKTCSLLAFIAATVLVSLQLSKALSLRQDTLFLKFHPMYSGTLLPQPFPTGRPSSSPGAGPAFAFVIFPKVPLCPSLPPVQAPLKSCTALRGSATPPNLLSPVNSLRSHHRLCLSCSSSHHLSYVYHHSSCSVFPYRAKKQEKIQVY